MSGTDHVGFSVSNLDKSVDFYAMLLDRDPKFQGPATEESVERIVGFSPIELAVAYFDVPGSDLMLELLEYRTPPSAENAMETFRVGNAHLCLVVDDLAAEYERLGKAGVVFTHPEPTPISSGMYEGGLGAYLRDPDGITVELLERPEKANK